MLARRTRPKLRQDAPKCEWPKHRKFVRGRECIVPGCGTGQPIECCHVRKGLPANTPSWARGGTARKPHDAFTFPACRHHHARQHDIGESEFERWHGISLLKEALDLARHSPCEGVRAFVREHKL